MRGSVEIVRGAGLSHSDLVEMVRLNREVYSAGTVGSIEGVESIFARNPDVCIAAKDAPAGRLIGYLSAIPLRGEAFARLLDPGCEEIVRPEEVVRYERSPQRHSWLHLYVASIVVAPAWRKQGVFGGIYDAFLDFLLEAGKARGIFFRDIAARTLPAGEKVCRALGMEFRGLAANGERIYYSEMPPPALGERSERGAKVVALYAAARRR